MALVGNLRDLKLPNLIQLNCMERNTAKLTVEHSGKYGILYFHNGQVVHAEFDPDIGEQALFRMLSLNDGKFKVEGGVRAPMVSIQTHWNNLLLEGLHKVDTIHHTDEGKLQAVIEMIKNVKGVRFAAILDEDGQALAGELTSDHEPLLQMLARWEAEAIGSELERANPRFLSIETDHRRVLLARHNAHLVYIDVEAKHQLDTVLPLIQKALG